MASSARGILVLDFGSQYTQLIARRIRELNVYCEVHSWDGAEQALQQGDYCGLILSGGPESLSLSAAPELDIEMFSGAIPVLGICYGMQLLCNLYGGDVAGDDLREFGPAELRVQGNSPLFANIDSAPQTVWMSHGDRVETLPDGFECIAVSDNSPYAAVAHRERAVYGLQFHPEVDHTPCGLDVLRAFVSDICGAPQGWTADDIINEQIQSIRAQVGSDKVLLGLSGGVDSAVAAMLLHQAIGDALQCVFVDNGLLRKDEGDSVMQIFSEREGMNVLRVNAGDEFLGALKGVDEPERKRKIIGEKFIRVFDQVSSELGDIPWLAQGTIYSDVIESAGAATGKARLIKSHHNVGGLPSDMKFKLIEPLRMLFKDEVRRVGRALGLSSDIIDRHQFPGPSLGVRVLGEVRPEYVEILRRADHIFMQELHASGWYSKLAQAFAVFLPVKAVGVVGDARRYAWTIALRAVETQDFMTARWSHLPHELLDKISTRILNEIEQVARVTYDISNKPPATVEWE